MTEKSQGRAAAPACPTSQDLRAALDAANGTLHDLGALFNRIADAIKVDNAPEVLRLIDLGEEMACEACFTAEEVAAVARDFLPTAVETPQASTKHNSFGYCSMGAHSLFQVQEGIPADDALEEVSSILSSALDAATSAALTANGVSGGTMFAAKYLIESAKAVVDSVVSGMAVAMRQAEAQGGEADHV